jgi:hypothetical protein
LYNGVVGPVNYTLTGGSISSPAYDTQIIVALTALDVYYLKGLGIALTNMTTWLTLQDSSVLDSAGNGVQAVTTLNIKSVATFVPDTVPPTLTAFTLNLNTSVLMVTFSEPMDSTTISVNYFMLQSAATFVLGTTSYSVLTPSSSGVVNSGNFTVFQTNIGNSDMNALKLWTPTRTVYLSLAGAATAMTDRSKNAVNVISNSSALVASSVAPDVTAPTLVSFNLNMTGSNQAVLTLTFSEVMNISSVVPTFVTLQGQVAGNNLTLTGGTVQGADGTVVTILLNLYDTNRLKANNYASSTFLAFTSAFAADMSSNLVTAVSQVGVSVYSPDMLAPQLLEFSLNVNTGVLVLSFSETVNASSFVASGIRIQLSNNTNIPADGVSLATSTVLNNSLAVVTVYLGDGDLNNLKLNPSLATSVSNTFISVQAAIQDMNNNAVVTIPTTNALQAYTLLPNSLAPSLLAYGVNMDSGVLSLTFSAPVDPTTLDASKIIFQNKTQSVLGYTVALTTSYIVTPGNSKYINLTISSLDLNKIKVLQTVAYNVSSSYLVVNSGMINDLYGNPLNAIGDGSALRVTSYSNDITQPIMVNFSVDFDSNSIILTFSETIYNPSFNVTGLT